MGKLPSGEFSVLHNLFGKCVSISQFAHSLFRSSQNLPQVRKTFCVFPKFWSLHDPFPIRYFKMHIKTARWRPALRSIPLVKRRKNLNNLAAALQRSPHLLFGRIEGEDVMVLVAALSEAHGAQQVHVTGTEVLQGATVDGTASSPLIAQDLHHAVHPE